MLIGSATMYKDDIKLFAKNEKEFETYTMKKIEMEFGIKKQCHTNNEAKNDKWRKK